MPALKTLTMLHWQGIDQWGCHNSSVVGLGRGATGCGGAWRRSSVAAEESFKLERSIPPLCRSRAPFRSFAGAHLVVAPRAVAPRVMSTAAKASVGKRELVAIVREKTGLSKEQAETAVNTVLDTVVGTVAKGEGCGG